MTFIRFLSIYSWLRILLTCCCLLVAPQVVGANKDLHPTKNTLPLTVEERAWSNAHDGKIRLAPAPNWEPLEFFDENGEYQGLVADYFRLIEKRLGITFQIIRVPS